MKGVIEVGTDTVLDTHRRLQVEAHRQPGEVSFVLNEPATVTYG